MNAWNCLPDFDTPVSTCFYIPLRARLCNICNRYPKRWRLRWFPRGACTLLRLLRLNPHYSGLTPGHSNCASSAYSSCNCAHSSCFDLKGQHTLARMTHRSCHPAEPKHCVYWSVQLMPMLFMSLCSNLKLQTGSETAGKAIVVQPKRNMHDQIGHQKNAQGVRKGICNCSFR